MAEERGLVEELRAVISAARAWYKQPVSEADAEDKNEALQDAVKGLEDALVLYGEKKPSGFKVHRLWSEVKAGEWVSPNGRDWFEVIRTSAFPEFRVWLIVGGKQVDYPRDPNKKVMVRTRTKAEVPPDAIELLKNELGAEVLGEYTVR